MVVPSVSIEYCYANLDIMFEYMQLEFGFCVTVTMLLSCRKVAVINLDPANDALPYPLQSYVNEISCLLSMVFSQLGIFLICTLDMIVL